MPKPNMNCGDHYIDFRSDTVTLPTDEMLDAMRNAKVGDDVYEDDPTTKAVSYTHLDVYKRQN